MNVILAKVTFVNCNGKNETKTAITFGENFTDAMTRIEGYYGEDLIEVTFHPVDCDVIEIEDSYEKLSDFY